MSDASDFEQMLEREWDNANRAGDIVYRSDTLTERVIACGGQTLHLLHNGCRDDYDKQPKPIDGDKPERQRVFSDGGNPELVVTEDGAFRVIGNRFACVQYQCILVPSKATEVLSVEFLRDSVRFAVRHPRLTLMYNALGAGKTVPNQYWLLSFRKYDGLADEGDGNPVCNVLGIPLQRQLAPIYRISFPITGDPEAATNLLLGLTSQLEGRDFNMFLAEGRAVFIPRRSVEIPSGFSGHRFGGLEMIGHFIMKSREALEAADPASLLKGIDEIGLQFDEQRQFESHLTNLDLTP